MSESERETIGESKKDFISLSDSRELIRLYKFFLSLSLSSNVPFLFIYLFRTFLFPLCTSSLFFNKRITPSYVNGDDFVNLVRRAIKLTTIYTQGVIYYIKKKE